LEYLQPLVISLEKGPAGTKKALINMKKEWVNTEDKS
jgi:hypothetical protein